MQARVHELHLTCCYCGRAVWVVARKITFLLKFMLVYMYNIWLYYFRLGISYPELTEMQVRAIFQAGVTMSNQGVTVLPEIMVPLVGTPEA